jgi:hypothetical protein
LASILLSSGSHNIPALTACFMQLCTPSHHVSDRDWSSISDSWRHFIRVSYLHHIIVSVAASVVLLGCSGFSFARLTTRADEPKRPIAQCQLRWWIVRESLAHVWPLSLILSLSTRCSCSTKDSPEFLHLLGLFQPASVALILHNVTSRNVICPRQRGVQETWRTRRTTSR